MTMLIHVMHACGHEQDHVFADDAAPHAALYAAELGEELCPLCERLEQVRILDDETAERITREVQAQGLPEHIQGSSVTTALVSLDEDWVCLCGNTSTQDGFDPCDATGTPVEPTPAAWPDPLYVCDRCGRIIDQLTLRVCGTRTPA